MGVATTFRLDFAKRKRLTPSASELEFAAILIATGLERLSSAAILFQFLGLARKKCADANWRPSAKRTSSNSGGHLQILSISRSYQLQPARIASARTSNWFAMVPRKRPPASIRRQVAIKVARGRLIATRRRKA